MKISFGDILLARFPFTDLTSDKVRPVLVVSADNEGEDVVICTITSRPHRGRFDLLVEPDQNNGLKARSWIQLNKIATLERTVIAGRMGRLPEGILTANKSRFFEVFEA